MRITGGKYCGRKVSCPPGIIRPAMDRMRESMFAILGDLTGMSFLDLFSGSGIVALEALSRGAEKAVLVEKDHRKKTVIYRNISIALNGPDSVNKEQIIILMRPVERILKPDMEVFDIVHLDPPFPMKNKAGLLIMADKAGQPAVNGTLMIHYPSEETLPEVSGSLRQYDLRRYGRSELAFYTRDK